MDKNSIALIGFMGTGKSTVAKILNKKLNIECIETDNEIEQSSGKPINEIFKENGEKYFRDLESELLKKLNNGNKKIISCGGGIVLRDKNIKMLKDYCKVILLTSCSQSVYKRINNCKNRPILNNNMTMEYIEELQENRRSKYEKAADIIISTDEKSPEEIADEIIELSKK